MIPYKIGDEIKIINDLNKNISLISKLIFWVMTNFIFFPFSRGYLSSDMVMLED